MKKLLLVGAFATFGVLALSSCKKDYTCECKTTVGSLTSTSTSTINGKKKDAKEACDKKDSSITGASVACEIK
jgi:hypothetical protein